MAKFLNIRIFIQKKIVHPVLDFLKQGLSPSLLSEAITWGILIGVIPILGLTSTLCAIVSVLRKINMGAIQLVNWLVYPLQLIFYIPFIRAGGWLMNAPIPISINQVKTMIHTDIQNFIRLYAKANLGAVFIWMLISIIVGFILKLYLKKVFENIVKEKNR